jgi:hypothetical protein
VVTRERRSARVDSAVVVAGHRSSLGIVGSEVTLEEASACQGVFPQVAKAMASAAKAQNRPEHRR